MYNEKVKCIKGHSGAGLHEGEVYTIAVICHDWTDHIGRHTGTGYIVRPVNAGVAFYPYVWDSTRFEAFNG